VIAVLEERASLSSRPNPDDGVASIAVDQSKVYQRVEGGGAAFTDGAAWLINRKLSAAQRDPVRLRLFDSRAGIGLQLFAQSDWFLGLNTGLVDLGSDCPQRHERAAGL
jgi:hypothetical protein